MRQHGLLESGLQRDTWCPFINHYQFYRELLLALQKGGYFVLLGDARSPVFVRQDRGVAKGTRSRLVALLSPRVRSSVAYLTVQQLVERAEQIGGHDWTAAFRAKYVLRNESQTGG